MSTPHPRSQSKHSQLPYPRKPKPLEAMAMACLEASAILYAIWIALIFLFGIGFFKHTSQEAFKQGIMLLVFNSLMLITSVALREWVLRFPPSQQTSQRALALGGLMLGLAIASAKFMFAIE